MCTAECPGCVGPLYWRDNKKMGDIQLVLTADLRRSSGVWPENRNSLRGSGALKPTQQHFFPLQDSVIDLCVNLTGGNVSQASYQGFVDRGTIVHMRN